MSCPFTLAYMKLQPSNLQNCNFRWYTLPLLLYSSCMLQRQSSLTYSRSKLSTAAMSSFVSKCLQTMGVTWLACNHLGALWLVCNCQSVISLADNPRNQIFQITPANFRNNWGTFSIGEHLSNAVARDSSKQEEVTRSRPHISKMAPHSTQYCCRF